MAATENRLMALTYITAYVSGDEFQTQAIETEMSKDDLIEELASISVILASTVGLFMNKEVPQTIPEVMDLLRRVVND
jgi:peptidoglycan hydrolase-like amidase